MGPVVVPPGAGPAHAARVTSIPIASSDERVDIAALVSCISISSLVIPCAADHLAGRLIRPLLPDRVGLAGEEVPGSRT
jgi:hypothetical protein